MSEHTPGPWHWHRGPGPNIYAEDGTEIGQINFSVDGDLVAAAPDLLAACEMLAEAQRRADVGEHGFGAYVDAVDMARAAIAKARGK